MFLRKLKVSYLSVILIMVGFAIATVYVTVPYSTSLTARELYPILDMMMAEWNTKYYTRELIIMSQDCDSKTTYTYEQYAHDVCEDTDKEDDEDEWLEVISAKTAQALIEKKIKYKSQSKKRDYQIGLRQHTFIKCNFEKKEESEHIQLNNENMKKILELAGKGLEDITLTLIAEWSMG